MNLLRIAAVILSLVMSPAFAQDTSPSKDPFWEATPTFPRVDVSLISEDLNKGEVKSTGALLVGRLDVSSDYPEFCFFLRTAVADASVTRVAAQKDGTFDEDNDEYVARAALLALGVSEDLLNKFRLNSPGKYLDCSIYSENDPMFRISRPVEVFFTLYRVIPVEPEWATVPGAFQDRLQTENALWVQAAAEVNEKAATFTHVAQ